MAFSEIHSYHKLLLEDLFFPDSLRLASEAVFAERKDKANYIDYELKVYKGTCTSISLGYFFTFILHRNDPWFRIAGQFIGSRIEASPWRGVGPNSRMVQEDFGNLKFSFIYIFASVSPVTGFDLGICIRAPIWEFPSYTQPHIQS